MKGNVWAQVLMIVFSILYGIISFRFRYWGEMITYLPRHIWSLEGVSCIISTPLFSISSAILQGSIISSSSAITAHFPIQKASRVSVIKVSKITPEAHKISPGAVSNIQKRL